MNVANHLATANLTSSAVGTAIRANAKVHLAGDYPADATLDTQAIPLQPIFAIYAPEQAADLSGQTEVHATLHGPLNNTKQLEAHLTIPDTQAGLQQRRTVGRDCAHQGGLQRQRSDAAAFGAQGNRHRSAVSRARCRPPRPHLCHWCCLGTVNLHLAQVFEPRYPKLG